MSKVRSYDVHEEMEFHGEKTFHSEHGYPKLKRQRIETRIKLNPPWPGSSGLPSLGQSFSSALKSFKEDSSYARRCFNASMKPVSSNSLVDEVCDSGYSSDVTKLDVIDNSPPLDNKGLGTTISSRAKATRVSSFDELFTITSKREERPVEIVVEPMKCDEVTTMSTKKRNKRDVSLVERFTEDEIKLHIMSLKEGSSNQVTTQSGFEETCEGKEEACQLCGENRIMFPAQPIYCSLCGNRIKDESFYYIPEEEIGQQHQICNPCHTRSRNKFMLCGISITKANMFRKSNLDNQIAEEWVQCESCEKWQHSICGLYNQKKDFDKTADYICPHCLLEERQSINYTGCEDNTDLGARDLPETILSHFIEQRLSRRLKEERYQTAKATGKSIDDVSEPEELTIRVVFSADKSSNVNQQFVNLLQKEHYPSEFPYRSKVILLFQKVEGVDVCIFALFVQEFGSECSSPNQRSIYILYLDSVKYFRPERATFSGEALRTFVYHEILIGYLEYCKTRGFTTAYIWACPPPKGEDYIMYSHPKTQKSPNPNKLRQWYVSMLEKAAEQRVVASVTNLYDRFFVSKEKNITAARLPYFEGAFWSYSAENLIQEIEQEGNNELQKKVDSLSRRQLKGFSYKSTNCADLDGAKKILLMQKLEKMILKNKEDFMVVELNYSCTRCSKPILSGVRWFCEKCKNLQLCEKCYDEEQELPGEHIHTMNGKEKHFLSKASVNGIQSTTEDNDVILQNDIFESRQVFLSFSQKHNYNFGMLRRAKHSTMMILHHLHTSNKDRHHSQNSTSLLQVTCTVCNKDVSATIYFPCLVCSDYRACTGCYNQQKNLRQLHLFPMLPSAHGTPPRTVGVLEILKALLHAHACRPTATKSCSYPKCYEVKRLFHHSGGCKIKEKGACKICINLWQIIRIHAYHCQDPNCSIPRCRDMKEYLTKSGVRL